MFVAAPLVAWLGPDRLAIRLPTAVAGLATILATWALARELFYTESRRLAQLAGLLSALFLSLSFWLLVINRIGLRANYLPLMEVLCFLFLWRALRTRSLWAYGLSGLFLGLAFHTYISARFVPVVVVLLIGVLLATRRGRALVLARPRGWLLMGGVALLVASPLLVFFLTHPESFLERAGQVSIFSPKLHHGDPLGLWVRSLLGNLGVFGFAGDHNPLYNLPGRPGLDPVQAVLFWIGIGLCLLRWRRPNYVFLIVWWLTMLLPSIVAPDPIPHYLRAIGALPAAAIIAARPLAGFLASPPRLTARLQAVARPVAVVALGIYVVLAGYGLWHTYFKVWLARDDVYYAYYGHLADLAGQINADTLPETVYLFPVNYDRRFETYNAYTTEILYRGPTPFHYIIVDDASVARDLTAMAAGSRRVNVIVWTNGEHIDADPRQVLPFYLERFGQKTGEQALRGYRIDRYELPSTAVDFSAPLDWTPLQAGYGSLRLVGESHAGDAPSGEAVWVALRWQVVQPVPGDLKVSLRLADGQGHLLGQNDSGLMDNAHRSSQAWVPGEEVITYHLLPILPGTLPAQARLSLVLYDPVTLQPVPAAGQQAAPPELALGEVQVMEPVRELTVEPELPLTPTRLARGLELIGYGQDRGSLAPGETLQLALYWHVRRDLARDHVVLVRLVDPAGSTAVEWAQAPTWPTSNWRAGQTWRDWHDLAIPPGTPPGTYQLLVQLQTTDLPGTSPLLLGSIQIED